MLSGEEKTYLINEMKKLMDEHGKKAPKNTQIRKYAATAIKSDCKEEFLNYLHYQIGRASNNDEKTYLMIVLDKLNEIEKRFKSDEMYLKALGLFFGYMARYKKYLDEINHNRNNQKSPANNNYPNKKNFPPNKTNEYGKRR
ncbi:hypothetical protein HWHPT5561_08575 [Petrotoga sp. HWH.PT.55.6.1]|jgi:hypothetical protein|uniref:hypothetical protein n=1 Tax=unclassified Petrotoga TaxID=2620614 RepID=UPI000CA044E9|nr:MULTISPECIES: hypothetical protein [unclassified Petrotoga]MBL5982012.1 hypothetical protein [Petrotoga sp. 8T1HF07.NaAc.6.1]PNR88503.1 hypothetical protein X925_06185 [Petrotoga sp. 9T1HF07.CasAA.8.2]PNR94428.1 hypothetical protein X926_00355 [Petrotoga sp. HWHPT.55.6.3]RPD35374.1 hypothetical protein HWHPT5561_08575 [Petrotoga sp. HWH.PT.55.6.1]